MRSLSLSLSLSFFLCLADALVRVTLLVAHGQEDEEAEEMPEKHRVTIKSNYNLSRRCVRFDRDFDRIYSLVSFVNYATTLGWPTFLIVEACRL